MEPWSDAGKRLICSRDASDSANLNLMKFPSESADVTRLAATPVRIIALGLFLVTLALYAPASRFDFVNYDDNVFVTENPMVLGGLTWGGVREAFLTAPADYWRPLSWVSHMLDVELFGLDAGAHHLTNVLIHALNSVLLFLALLRLTGRQWPSAIVAALFAWHPLHVESVAWIAERKDVLCATFWFLTLLAYERYARNPSVKSYSMVLGCFILGLMSKPMIVTLPFALLLLDYWPLGRFERDATRRAWLRLLAEKLPMLLLAGVVSVVTYVNQKQVGATLLMESFPLRARSANSVVAYVEYLRKMFWPADLAVLYPLPTGWPVGRVIFSCVILVAVTLMAVVWLRKRPFVVVGWCWFLGTLVPVIGLVQVGAQFIADRYTYIPLIGLFIAVVWIATTWADRNMRGLKWLTGATVVVLIGCAIGTAQQLRHWRNTMTLFERAVAVTQYNYLAHNDLGVQYLAAGRTNDALHQFIESLKASPHRGHARYNLAGILASQGRHAEARAQYALALIQQADQNKIQSALDNFAAEARKNPMDPEASYYLANALSAVGRGVEAIAPLENVVRVKPDYATAHIDLGVLLAQQGRMPEAARHYTEAIRLDPANDLPHANLGGLLANSGRLEDAITHYREAIRLRPDNPITRYNFGLALTRTGHDAEAAAEFREAFRINPDNANAINKLAWLLCTSPDDNVRNGSEALRLAEQLLQMTRGQQAMAFDTLAAALAECGRFDDAVSAATKAQELAVTGKQSTLAGELAERVKLYQTGRPYRRPQ